jgi:hypothetical protein
MTTKCKTQQPAHNVTTLLWAAFAAAALLAPLVGCKCTRATPTTQYVLVTTLAGSQIKASLDRPASLDSSDDHALITFGHHRLRVEKGRGVLDDNETAAFPATAARIDIVISQGTLRMTADGEEMWKKLLPTE